MMTSISDIRHDPDMLNLLSRLPKDTAESLTDQQLQHLKIAIGTGQYRKHKIDIRGTFALPFYPSRIYFVLLMGRNLRSLSRQEQAIEKLHICLMACVFLVLSTALGVIALYLLKSMLGKDIVEAFSVGLWDWLKEN